MKSNFVPFAVFKTFRAKLSLIISDFYRQTFLRGHFKENIKGDKFIIVLYTAILSTTK